MATKNVLVRILQSIRIHTTDYLCNDVVSMPAKLAAAHEKAGAVDSDLDAVAFARDELGAVPKEHVVPEGVAVLPADGQPTDAGGAAASVSAESAQNGQAGAQAQASLVDPAGQ